MKWSTEESNLNPFESNRFPGGHPSTQISCSIFLLDNISTPVTIRPCFRTIAIETSPTATLTSQQEESHVSSMDVPQAQQSVSKTARESSAEAQAEGTSQSDSKLLHGVRSGTENDPLCHYCIVRRDLPRGAQAAQLIHAAGESSPGNLPASTFAVALTCRDENELQQLAIRLDRDGCDFVLIREPDAPYHGQLMAIGVRPTLKSKVRRSLSNFPLVK